MADKPNNSHNSTPPVKSGARHSKPDHEHGSAALDHLVKAKDHLQQAGFGASDGPKSLTSTKSTEMLDCLLACQSCLAACQQCMAVCRSCPNSLSATHTAVCAACQSCADACAACQSAADEHGLDSAECMAACAACQSACAACAAACMACAVECDHCAWACQSCAEACASCARDCGDCLGGAADADSGADEAAEMAGMGKSADTLVAFGGELKALGSGKVGGYLVRFSTASDPDLTGDFFTKDTDFGDAIETDVYYQHGLDPVLGKRRLTATKAKLKKDDVGVWMEAQLAMRDDYEKAVYSLSEKGKQGLSSGTAGHLVEREPVGKATWIKSWPLGLDGSITPTPAEPRTSVWPIKSYAKVAYVEQALSKIEDQLAELVEFLGAGQSVGN